MKLRFSLPSETGIKRRLQLYLGGGLLLMWLLTVAGSAAVSLHEINEAEDSRMSQLARTLSAVTQQQREAVPIADIQTAFGGANGDAKSHNDGFAVWNREGRLLLADRRGAEIPFQTASGFADSGPIWRGGAWRYLYLHDAAAGHTVAVSQRLAERFAVLTEALWLQLALSLLFLLPLLALSGYAIRRGLQPLDSLSAGLAARDVGSTEPLDENLPSELRPLAVSLNRHLARVAEGFAREQRFTADAAHELRSPLAALSVQTEVLAMSTDENDRLQRLAAVRETVGRASHLIDQLLLLSRLDPMQALPDSEVIDWPATAEQALRQVSLPAREKRVRLHLEQRCAPQEMLPLSGNGLLLQLMLRNLLDNAVRYSPEGRNVRLVLAADCIAVQDEGGGIAPEYLHRIGERFFRPPGQVQTGSGLGLSIVSRIAALHGLRLTLTNRNGGLCALLERA